MYEEIFIDWDTHEFVHRIDGAEVERRPATEAEMYIAPPAEDPGTPTP